MKTQETDSCPGVQTVRAESLSYIVGLDITFFNLFIPLSTLTSLTNTLTSTYYVPDTVQPRYYWHVWPMVQDVGIDSIVLRGSAWKA